MSWAVTRQYRALRLSPSLVSVTVQRTRTTPRWARQLQHAISQDYVFSGVHAGVLPDGTMWGSETHRHDYTRPPASLGDELGELSTSLELSASPPLILSTESVVVMVWKGMSTWTAASTEVYRESEAAHVAMYRRAHALPLPPRLIRSRVSVGDLQRVPARCSIRPAHRPYT